MIFLFVSVVLPSSKKRRETAGYPSDGLAIALFVVCWQLLSSHCLSGRLEIAATTTDFQPKAERLVCPQGAASETFFIDGFFAS